MEVSIFHRWCAKKNRKWFWKSSENILDSPFPAEWTKGLPPRHSPNLMFNLRQKNRFDVVFRKLNGAVTCVRRPCAQCICFRLHATLSLWKFCLPTWLRCEAIAAAHISQCSTLFARGSNDATFCTQRPPLARNQGADPGALLQTRGPQPCAHAGAGPNAKRETFDKKTIGCAGIPFGSPKSKSTNGTPDHMILEHWCKLCALCVSPQVQVGFFRAN